MPKEEAQTDLEDYLRRSVTHLDENGHEIMDPRPMAPPVGYNRQPSLTEQIRNMVRSEKLRQEAEAAGMETFEEADDFEVGDDYEPSSPYEADFDLPTWKEDDQRAAAEKKAAEEVKGGGVGEPPPPMQTPAGGASKSKAAPKAPPPKPSEESSEQ